MSIRFSLLGIAAVDIDDLDDGILTLAAESDSWNDRVRRDIAEMKRKEAAAHEADLLRERMDRAHEFDERWKSANSTQILVSKDPS